MSSAATKGAHNTEFDTVNVSRPTRLRSHEPGAAAAAAAICAARARASGPGAFVANKVCDAVVVVDEAAAAAVVAVVEAGAVGGDKGGLLRSLSSPSFPPLSTAGFAAQNPGGDRVPRLFLSAESLLVPLVMLSGAPRGDTEAAAGFAASAGVAGGGDRVSGDACNQGLTLVHFSAQRKRLLWDRGCV